MEEAELNGEVLTQVECGSGDLSWGGMSQSIPDMAPVFVRYAPPPDGLMEA